MTGRKEMKADRVEELEEAVRNILDVATGWTRTMTPHERLAAIKRLGYAALGIVGRHPHNAPLTQQGFSRAKPVPPNTAISLHLYSSSGPFREHREEMKADQIKWTRFDYVHGETLWQRDCPDCDRGLLLAPARFCSRCGGSGYLVASTDPEAE